MKLIPSFCKYCNDKFYSKADKESIFETGACTWCYKIADMIKADMEMRRQRKLRIVRNGLDSTIDDSLQ